jgi:hypothetical protein
MVVVLIGAALFAASPAVAVADMQIEIQIEPATVDTVIGTETPLRVTITNPGSDRTGPLVAHLVVVDPNGGSSADAEDWTSTLNRPLDGLAPGESRSIAWDVAPVMAGAFRLMVSVVPLGEGPPAVSTQVRFGVSQPDVLVSGATLPVAIAMPLLAIGAAVLTGRAERRLARRRMRPA